MKSIATANWSTVAGGISMFGIAAGGVHAADIGNDEDGEFLARAVAVSQQEVNDAKGAVQVSSHARVRQAAEAIEIDHLKAEHALADLARQKRVIASADSHSPWSPSRSTETRMENDADGIAALLKTHEEAVALFHQEAIRGMDPDVKNFAQTTLPTLQRRLEVLRLLQISYPEKPTEG